MTAISDAQNSKRCDRPTILVCGPWGSGTSAITGMLRAAGIDTPGPWHVTDDEKTPETFEWTEYRELLSGFISHSNLKRIASKESVIQNLTAFKEKHYEHFSNIKENSESPVLLKHALSIPFIPEISKVFEIKIIIVLRSLADIEATRLRRKWSAIHGESGAKYLYGLLFGHVTNNDIPVELIRYNDVLHDPQKALSRLLHFCEFPEEFANLPIAIASVRR